MDLWIRKQDGEALLKTDYLFIEKGVGESYDIKSYLIGSKPITVATYTTKQKALQILNEVQNILVTKLVRKPSGEIVELNHSCKVYAFPKDTD